MKLLTWFKSLFATDKSAKTKEALVVITRRGFDITLPVALLTELEENGYYLSLALYNSKPSSIQVTASVEGKPKYICTLKKYYNVKAFKNDNILDYSHDNLIFND